MTKCDHFDGLSPNFSDDIVSGILKAVNGEILELTHIFQAHHTVFGFGPKNEVTNELALGWVRLG